MDPWTVLKFPHLSEKSIGLVESDNKLVFMVADKATKTQVKWAVEKAFAVKVEQVRVLIDRKGRKKAFVRLSKDNSALEIATKMGML